MGLLKNHKSFSGLRVATLFSVISLILLFGGFLGASNVAHATGTGQLERTGQTDTFGKSATGSSLHGSLQSKVPLARRLREFAGIAGVV